MYTLFEHTADIGIRVAAATVEDLFADAACGLFAIIVDQPDAIQQHLVREWQIAGTDREYLLVDWLSELLSTFELEHLVFRRFEVELTATGLRARGWGEPFDSVRHRQGHEAKAITYHALQLTQTAAGWAGQVIVDI